MPRPIPVSNRLAERDRLKVAMHWYWFQVLSIRSACGSGHSTWKRDSSSSQSAARPARAPRRPRPGTEYAVPSIVPTPALELRHVALLDVGEHEGEGLLLARRELQVDLVRADGVPAVCDAAGGAAGERHCRLVQAVVDADEGVARGVEAVDLPRAAEQRHVVAALAVLGRVVDRRAGPSTSTSPIEYVRW